jgi:dGTPase
VVELLEQKYPLFSGLNLTWEVREGLFKHSTSFDHPSRKGRFPARSFSLEAQVANLADEITYYSHDLDDGLTAGLLSEQRLNRDVRIWRQAARAVKKRYGDLPDECRRYYIIRCIIDDQVHDVVLNAEARLQASNVRSADEVRKQRSPLVQYSDGHLQINLEVREYLYRGLYYNPEVHEPNRRAMKMLEELFHYFHEHPHEMGEQARKRAAQDGLPRAVCDYLAGMTDRYAVLEHQRLFGLNI